MTSQQGIERVSTMILGDGCAVDGLSFNGSP